MNTKRPKVKKVVLQPPPGEGVCHNKLCRRRIVGKLKVITFGDGYEATLCMHCFGLFEQRKWTR